MIDRVRRLIPERFSATALLVIIALVIVFHGLVMTGSVPFEIVWGGRLKNISQMILFESVSLVLNLIMFVAVAIHSGVFKTKLRRKITTPVLWLMTILFLLNTLGNLFSSNPLEKIIFTPLTVALCLLSFRLAIAGSGNDVNAEMKQ